MSTTQVETVTTGADKAKLAAAGLLVIAGVAAFYLVPKDLGLWVRVLALLALVVAAVAVFFVSSSGRELIAFGQDSIKELRKVVWPTGAEARQMTLYVFAFVVVMALFLWATDKTLEWVLYGLILGWKH